MTGPDGGALNGASRRGLTGVTTNSERVEVYKILLKAVEPLTIPEIAKQFPPGYGNAANMAYRAHKEQTDPTWLEGKGTRWSDEAQAEAMVWWVRQVVKLGVQSKYFIAKMKGTRYPNSESTYVPGRPPIMKRKVWVEKTIHVPFSLDEETALNRKQVAGMQFLTKLDKWRQRPKLADAKELIDLAEDAIRNHNRESDHVTE